jgi:hypothetical protein
LYSSYVDIISFVFFYEVFILVVAHFLHLPSAKSAKKVPPIGWQLHSCS